MSERQLTRSRVAKSLVRDFMPRFAQLGEIVWSSVRGIEAANESNAWLRDLARSPAGVAELPSMVVRDKQQRRLWLIEIAARGRQLTTDRCNALRGSLARLPEHLLFLNGFKNRRALGRLVLDHFWGTMAWFADEPEHLVFFDDDAIRRGVRPYERCLPRGSSDSNLPPYSNHASW